MKRVTDIILSKYFIIRQNTDSRDGRPKKYSRVQLNYALGLLETHSYKQVERLTGISVTTIYRAKLNRAEQKAHNLRKIREQEERKMNT